MRVCSPLAGLCSSALKITDHDSGTAAIEFAFIAPLLILSFVCIADLGLGIYA